MIVLSSNHYKPHFGGIENSLFFLSQEYKILGFDTIIFVSDNGLGKNNRLPEIEIEDGVKIIRYKSYFPKFYIDYIIKPFIEIYRAKEKLIKLRNMETLNIFA